jgi:hypothetical protein
MVVYMGSVDQNTWNTFPVSEQKTTLNNQTKQSKRNRNRNDSNQAESNTVNANMKQLAR